MKSVFVVRPTDRTSVAQGLFRWVWRRAVAQHARQLQKCLGPRASVPVGIPLKKGAKPSPVEES